MKTDAKTDARFDSEIPETNEQVNGPLRILLLGLSLILMILVVLALFLLCSSGK